MIILLSMRTEQFCVHRFKCSLTGLLNLSILCQQNNVVAQSEDCIVVVSKAVDMVLFVHCFTLCSFLGDVCASFLVVRFIIIFVVI